MLINHIEQIEPLSAHKLAWLPLMFSLLIHVGVIGLLSFVSNVPPPVEIRDDFVPGLRVQLVKTLEPPPPVNPQEQALVESIEAVMPDTVANDSATDPIPAEPADEAPAPPDGAQMPATVAEGDQPAGDAPRQDLSGEQLEASMNAYISSYRSNIQQSWVEECIKYQNRHGVQDCTTSNDASYSANRDQREKAAQLFENYVTRKTDNQRYSRQLLAESEYLRGLMDDNPVLSNLAQQQYALVKARYCYMNPLQAGCTTPSFTSPEGDVIVIIDLVSLVLLLSGMDSVPTGLNMAEGQYGLQENTPAGENFSNFGAGKAESSQETDTFRIAPPLFPLR